VEVRSVPPLPVTDTDLGRITVNLVENAHRFAPGGRLKVSLTKDVRTVVLMVDDNGPGIPVEHRDAVFDRFYRVDPSRARASGGLGLGLSLVKALVEAAGGSVRADVSPEGGCRIIVTFHID
jgi:signal transduction histidine kinase